MIEICLIISGIMVVMGFILAGYRLHRGPSMFDRVLAGEALAICIVAMLVLLAFYTRSTYVLDVMLLISLLGFVTPTAFIDYLYNRHKHDTMEE